MTPIELNRKGFQALVNSLGYVDAVKFMHQFDHGSGNYTEERDQWLDQLTMEDIITDIKTYQNDEIPN